MSNNAMLAPNWLAHPLSRVHGWRRRYIISQPHQRAIDPATANLDDEIEQATQLFKHDKTTTVAKVSWPSKDYVLKRYNARSWKHALKRACRRSRAQGCWEMSFQFQHAGLNVAEPVMMLENRWGPFCGNAYFVNTLLHGKELLEVLPLANTQLQNRIADAIKQAFDIMQQHKLSHGDLKASNILWDEQGLVFIDLDAAQSHRSNTSWRFAHAKDKRRFLKNWRDRPDLLSLFESRGISE